MFFGARIFKRKQIFSVKIVENYSLLWSLSKNSFVCLCLIIIQIISICKTFSTIMKSLTTYDRNNINKCTNYGSITYKLAPLPEHKGTFFNSNKTDPYSLINLTTGRFQLFFFDVKLCDKTTQKLWFHSSCILAITIFRRLTLLE